MAGMFDWLFSSPTQGDASVPVSGDAGQAQAGGSGSGWQQNLVNNIDSITGTMMGYGGADRNNRWAGAALGAQRGSVLDAASRKERQANEEKKKRQMMLQQILPKFGMDPALAADPEQANAMLSAAYRNRLEQSNPTALERTLTDAGVKRGSDEWNSAMRNAAGLNKTGMQEVDPEKGYFITDAQGNRTYMPPGGMQGGGMTPKQIERETKFREETNKLPSIAQYNVAAPVYQSMHDTAGRGDQYSDLNLVYGLAKIFDPGSVVREGEQTLVRESQAWPEWLKGQIASVQGGAKLTPESRQKIMTEARSRVQAYRQQADTDLNRYGKIADQYGFDRSRTLPQLGDVPEWKAPEGQSAAGATGAPQIRSVDEYNALKQRGYRGPYVDPTGKTRTM